jgi:glyoxylase-like metal-dependent hydrolase (beta-lactamase superfamily II)/rhodanese-related sulfurtransferase
MTGLKQFRQEGCLSYLIFDRASREAAVIDPHMDLMEDYRSYIAEHGLKLRYALDTHIHADHYSATHLFQSEYGASGCKTGMSHRTQSERPVIRLKNHDKLKLNNLEIEVLETPGHTPDSVCYFADGVVFTGDTLLIGATGRTDFPGSDPAMQWDSLHQILAKLDDKTVVFPGHDYNSLIFSLMGVEKRTNPHLKMEDRAAFVAMKKAECIPHLSDEVQARVRFNQAASPAPVESGGAAGGATACGVANLEQSRVATINVEKYSHKLGEKLEGNLFIDVREEEEFTEGHMPGARNIPLSELGFHLSELLGASRVYLSCLSGRRSEMATKTLNHIGHSDAVNVAGGIKAWKNAGLPVTRN